MPGQSTRARKVADQLRRELAELLTTEMADPRLRGVSVSDVELTRDLRYAKVFVFCPQDADPKECLSALTRASGFLRRQIAQSMRLRQVPSLKFEVDDTLDRAAHLDSLIARAIPESGTPPADEENQ